MLSGHQELERFLEKRTSLFTKGIREIYRDRYGDAGSKAPIADMAKLISHTMILANLNARKRVLMEADHARRHRGAFDSQKTPLSPLTFSEAIEDLVTRDSRLAAGYREVSALYSTDHVFALAKSVNKNLTERIQKAINDLMGTGGGLPEFETVWREITPWAQSYGDTVYRTNCSTAYTAGRFTQAQDPDVQEVIPAMTYISMHLPASRPNHEAADGLIAATDDPVWDFIKPPNGYNCMCGVNFVNKYELERRGLLKDGKVVPYYPSTWSSAHPDPGFKHGAMSF